MTTGRTTSGDSHTQKAPLCLILYATALACVMLGWMVAESPATYIPGGVGLLLACLASAFHHLTVEDQGDVLAIAHEP